MHVLAHCNIEFVVLDEPTDLAILVAMTATGGALGNAVLTKGVETLGIITVDSTGQHGSFPPGPFDPGVYIVNTYAETAETGDFSASVTVNAAPCGVSRHTGPDGQDVVTVNQCGPIQWNNAAGGSFATKENWDPQTVPGLNNTAVFALDATYSVDVGTATSNAVEVSDGEVTFTNANYDVVTLSVGGTNEATLSVADGGSLFSSQSLIGLGGTGTVNLSGLNTFWDSGTLVVGSSGTGKLNLTDGASGHE